ncbi:MAG: chemotaxis-specific protein-glutamate methyltransferase CheB [Polyangiales bacterium]
MRELRVLVVDDSALNRRVITQALESVGNVTVVGQAMDGDEALKLAISLQPDLVTLDLEMPRMDGFTFLRLLMAKRPTPVLIVSSYASKENIFRALELGAVDFLPKPSHGKLTDPSAVASDLAPRVAVVRNLSRAAMAHRSLAGLGSAIMGAGRTYPRPSLEPDPVLPRRVILFAASTGGPAALVEIMKKLPEAGSYAVVIAQHMPEHFTHGFAQRLGRMGRLDFSEVLDVRELRRGRGYVCPGGACIEFVEERGRVFVRSAPPREEDRFVPSANRLFESAAQTLGRRAVAVVLTGMGDDGARGAEAVKRAGGMVIAESDESAVVYSMPEATIRTGSCDDILPLSKIGERLREIVG